MKNALVVTGIFLSFLLAAGCARLGKTGAPPAGASESVYVEQGSLAIKSKDYDRAIDNLSRALTLNPDSVEALNLLGMAWFYKKDYPTAEGKFTRAISLNASFSPAYNNLGNLYVMTGRTEKAEEFLKKAIGLSPRLVSAYYSLGALLLQKGRADEAMVYLAKGLDLDPSYLETHSSLIAETDARATAESEFAWARVYASRGDVERTSGHLEKAKKAGFRDWKRIETEREFDGVREDPEIQKFIKSDRPRPVSM
jgi:tetratricopeptide (TPR) repeat protein